MLMKPHTQCNRQSQKYRDSLRRSWVDITCYVPDVLIICNQHTRNLSNPPMLISQSTGIYFRNDVHSMLISNWADMYVDAPLFYVDARLPCTRMSVGAL